MHRNGRCCNRIVERPDCKAPLPGITVRGHPAVPRAATSCSLARTTVEVPLGAAVGPAVCRVALTAGGRRRHSCHRCDAMAPPQGAAAAVQLPPHSRSPLRDHHTGHSGRPERSATVQLLRPPHHRPALSLRPAPGCLRRRHCCCRHRAAAAAALLPARRPASVFPAALPAPAGRSAETE